MTESFESTQFSLIYYNLIVFIISQYESAAMVHKLISGVSLLKHRWYYNTVGDVYIFVAENLHI
jgi:hypothetical protein